MVLFFKIITAVMVTINANIILKTFVTPVMPAVSTYSLIVSCFVMADLFGQGSSREESLDFKPNQIANGENSKIKDNFHSPLLKSYMMLPLYTSVCGLSSIFVEFCMFYVVRMVYPNTLSLGRELLDEKNHVI